MKSNKISPTDLRLGNWIYPDATFRFPMQVVNIGTNHVYCDFEGNEGDVWEADVEEMHGIELTDRLLIILSSEIDDYGYWIGSDVICKGEDGYYIEIYSGGTQIYLSYLHELQNLLYAFRNDLVITDKMMRE